VSPTCWPRKKSARERTRLERPSNLSGKKKASLKGPGRDYKRKNPFKPPSGRDSRVLERPRQVVTEGLKKHAAAVELSKGKPKEGKVRVGGRLSFVNGTKFGRNPSKKGASEEIAPRRRSENSLHRG